MMKFVILVFSVFALGSCAHDEKKETQPSTKPTPPPSASHSEPLSKAVPSEVVSLNMAVEKAMRAHQPEMQKCYELALKKNKKAKGKIVANYKIGADNKAKDIKWTHFDRSLEAGKACFTKDLSTWTFEGLEQSAGKELSVENQSFTFGEEQ